MRIAGSAIRVDQARRVFARDHAVEQRADDAMLGAFGRANGDGVEMVLRREGVARVRDCAGSRRRCPNLVRTGRKAIVDDDGLMGTMKGAEAEMHDAGRDA